MAPGTLKSNRHAPAQAFGKALQVQWVQPGDLAAQLLGGGPPGAGGSVKPRGRAAEAPVAAMHTALLNLVRCWSCFFSTPLAGQSNDEPGTHLLCP